jgi:hypothetical protein
MRGCRVFTRPSSISGAVRCGTSVTGKPFDQQPGVPPVKQFHALVQRAESTMPVL